MERGEAAGRSGACACRSACVLTACLFAGCGARTGLDLPWIVHLEREPPAIVFLVHWDAGCDNSVGTCHPSDLYAGGRDYGEAVRFTLAQLVPALDEVALLGAMPSQTLRLGVDGPESEAPAWPASDSPGWCWTPPELTVPLGAGHGSLVQQYFSHESWPAGIGAPNGQGALIPNLPVVESALLAAGTERTDRLLVLIDDGSRGCDEVDALVVIDERRYAEIAGLYEEMNSHGVRTLVIGITKPWPAHYVHSQHQLRVLNAEAEGGGLPREPEDEGNPVFWYDYQDVGALQEVLRREIVMPYWCTLFAIEPIPSEVPVTMISTSGAEVPLRDSTRTNGWDFPDAERTSIGLFGDACEFARGRDDLAFVLADGV